MNLSIAFEEERQRHKTNARLLVLVGLRDNFPTERAFNNSATSTNSIRLEDRPAFTFVLYTSIRLSIV